MAVRLSILSLGVCLLASACVGPRSELKIPACVERFEVSGEHHRVSESRLVFNHGLDLPFSRTEVTVERPGGEREVITIVNSSPDLLRLFSAGIIGALSTAALGLYAYQVGLAGEGPLGATFWALPVGGAGLLFAFSVAMTGWSPPEDTVVPARCAGTAE